MSLSNVILKDPYWLLILLGIPWLIWLRGRRPVSVVMVPFAAAWHRPSLISPSRWPSGLTIFGLILLAVALARPQRIETKREVRSEGYDLILSIDLSGSMLAEDFEQNGQRLNRLQVIKPVIQAFITNRPSDRIGIVVFSGRSYTLAPLTFDHQWLSRQVERLSIGMIEDGTAIGDGLGVALTRLEQAARAKTGQRKGAFVVLLTDGANNRGSMTPSQATEIAKSRGVPVYTIGAGRDGLVPYPRMDQAGNRIGSRYVPSDLDEVALQKIAHDTGGRYFRADDLRTIESAFKAIDRAQKIEFQAKSYLLTTELFWWSAIPGICCVLLATLVSRRSSSPRAQSSKAPRSTAVASATSGRSKIPGATAS